MATKINEDGTIQDKRKVINISGTMYVSIPKIIADNEELETGDELIIKTVPDEEDTLRIQTTPLVKRISSE